MRKSRFCEAQIMDILRQAEGGLAVADRCCEHAISSAIFYKRRSQATALSVVMFDAHRSCWRSAHFS
jgi:putative transposase